MAKFRGFSFLCSPNMSGLGTLLGAPLHSASDGVENKSSWGKIIYKNGHCRAVYISEKLPPNRDC